MNRDEFMKANLKLTIERFEKDHGSSDEILRLAVEYGFWSGSTAELKCQHHQLLGSMRNGDRMESDSPIPTKEKE